MILFYDCKKKNIFAKQKYVFTFKNICMMETCPVLGIPFWIFYVVAIMASWEFVWKLIALWKAGRNNELGWFICIALFNTAGILPIIYLLINKKKNAID